MLRYGGWCSAHIPELSWAWMWVVCYRSTWSLVLACTKCDGRLDQSPEEFTFASWEPLRCLQARRSSLSEGSICQPKFFVPVWADRKHILSVQNMEDNKSLEKLHTMLNTIWGILYSEAFSHSSPPPWKSSKRDKWWSLCPSLDTWWLYLWLLRSPKLLQIAEEHQSHTHQKLNKNKKRPNLVSIDRAHGAVHPPHPKIPDWWHIWICLCILVQKTQSFGAKCTSQNIPVWIEPVVTL